MTASGNGVEVRDARTGDGRWSYRRSGWTLLGWASTGSRLVAYFERDGDRTDRVLVAFDALSGGLLWRREGSVPPPSPARRCAGPPGRTCCSPPTTRGGRCSGSRPSPATGCGGWPCRAAARLFEGGAHPSDGRESLAALGLHCTAAAGKEGAGSRLLAVDPAKGAVRWDRRLGSRESPEVSMLDGVTLASDGTALRAYDDKGRQVGVWKGDGVCGDLMCPGVRVSDRLLVVYHPEGSGPDDARMEAVDVSTGRVRWGRDVPAYAALAQAGGRVFALRPRLSADLLPAAVDIVDPGGGRATTAPVPFSLDPDLPGARPWLAAAGGLLYVAVPQAAPRPDGAARLLALRGGLTGPGPAELGGVPVADWPDACALLRKPDLAAARLTDHVTRPRRTSAGTVKLPHPVSCAYEPRRKAKREDAPEPGERASPEPEPSATGSAGPDPSASPEETGRPDMTVRGLTVSVRWVGDTDQAASRMLDALQATQAQARRRRDIGADEAYEIGPAAGMIALRVGRYVVAVEASRPPGAAARVARSVAYRLHHPS
ncbi:PQQ-binding-like beta-propeller repeat protein [Actinomadura madurae]|uniref:outer membrane protein assembly factor BamB family protein n=1 Tax=Actinomadura madurae TaxID=1993 RepID=UPI0020D25CF3|nr:PQQ-binding-like beta-propeller repeat protein [Actinomadura madurae]MCP9967358.1 PQQ-binding-like beta-propeller repeat protein [Actinomadura madurae]